MDNPATEEDTNKVASVDNNLATVDKVDTEEEMLPTVPVNPLVVRLLFPSLSLFSTVRGVLIGSTSASRRW